MDNFFSLVGGCFLFLVLTFAFFSITWIFISIKPEKNYKDEKKDEKRNNDNIPQLHYTVLNIDRRVSSNPWESTVYCKDGVVYAPTKDNIFGRKIGSFSYDRKVYYEQGYHIGSLSGTDDINIWLDRSKTIELYPYARSKILNSEKGFIWCAAEVLEEINTIIDKDDCSPIAYFKGNSREAAAAFVCWAFDSHDNKYSSFFTDYLHN